MWDSLMFFKGSFASVKKGMEKKQEFIVKVGMRKKQGIYCQRQKDDLDGFPFVHPTQRNDVAAITQCDR